MGTAPGRICMTRTGAWSSARTGHWSPPTQHDHPNPGGAARPDRLQRLPLNTWSARPAPRSHCLNHRPITHNGPTLMRLEMRSLGVRRQVPRLTTNLRPKAPTMTHMMGDSWGGQCKTATLYRPLESTTVVTTSCGRARAGIRTQDYLTSVCSSPHRRDVMPMPCNRRLATQRAPSGSIAISQSWPRWNICPCPSDPATGSRGLAVLVLRTCPPYVATPLPHPRPASCFQRPSQLRLRAVRTANH